MAAARCSSDDLAFAIDWLETYDATSDDDTNGAARDRVVAWLASQLEKRHIRCAAVKLGVSVVTVRKVVARLQAVT